MMSASDTKKEGPKLHPDAEYLLRPDIADILSKGLAELYERRPKNPVEYLALWLLNSSSEKVLKLEVR